MYRINRREPTNDLINVLIGIPTLVGGFAFIIALMSILHGLVLSIMWGWFITPLGVPTINIGEAIGISLVASLLGNFRKRTNEEILTGAFVSPFLLLLVGAVLHFVFGVGA